MHKFLLIIFLSAIAGHAFSQQQYFVYIQADEQQPFYVRLNEKIYSSTETGYLILSKLTNSSYDFLLGFPKNIYPEQRFRISMERKDKGYQLKNFGEKGWGLVNLQSQEVVMNTGISKQGSDLTGTRKTDAFSVMLASVVNDSAILYTEVRAKPAETTPQKKAPVVAKKEEKKVQTDTALTREEQTLVREITENPERLKDTNNYKLPESNSVITVYPKKDSPVVAVEKPVENKVTVSQPVAARPGISKYSEFMSGSFYQVTYLETVEGKTDTILINIPLLTDAEINNLNQQITSTQPPVEKKPETKSDTNKIVASSPTSPDTTQANKKPKIVMINSDCKNFATENDVDKLRIRILAVKDTDDKLAAAKKYFKTRCFTVQQIKALTELFTTDESKYQFLDIAYAFTSDSGNYYLLEEVIREDYYRNRFKAMIRK